MKKYVDITVCIAPGPDGDYTVRVSSDGGGGQGNATLHLPFTLNDLAGAVFGVAETTREAAIDPSDDDAQASAAGGKGATEFGVELFEALFQGEARDVLVAAESKVRDTVDTGIRIRLSMDLQAEGMAEVASLPWELMCRKGQRALAVSTMTPLVRSLDAPRSSEPRPFHAPLRILAMMSNPRGTAELDLQAERNAIEASWAKLPGVQVDFVRPVQSELLSRLAEGDYHVVHYMGHGDVEADGDGLLLMEHEDGSAHAVTGDVFAAWLADEPLRLVFLNACKTGTTSTLRSAHPFAGVASALIRERVPAVVAMQFPISDQAAIAFAQTFYQRIAQGLPVDAAVAEGRKALYSGKQAEWATPVLYMRSRDGALFEVPGDEPVRSAAATHVTSPAAARATAGEDPWGPDAGDSLRVFLATPDQNEETRHRRLSRALAELDWVRVVDAVPFDDVDSHAQAVDKLIRSADLSVHLLGASPGRRLDDDAPPNTLETVQLAQLEIGLDVARSQLAVMTGEDRESIENDAYAARIDELTSLPRDRSRFEWVVTEKNRIAEAVLAKLHSIRDERAARSAPPASDSTRVHNAFVDAHISDQEQAIELVAYLEDHRVDTEIRTSSDSPTADLALLEETVKKAQLYVLVAGVVDRRWVSSRKIAVMKSAAKSRAPVLLAKFAALPDAGADHVDITKSHFDISVLNNGDPAWVDALFDTEAGAGASG